MQTLTAHSYIDLFAGAGGISLGLFNAGWQGLFAIEKSEMAFSTLKHNLIDKKNHFLWPDWLPISSHDINEVIEKYYEQLEELKGKVDLITGGPPCQGFSFAGRRKHDDERNKLVDSYLKFIQIIKPSIIFFENVKGFTVGFKDNEIRSDPYSKYVTNRLEEFGYKIQSELIDFSNYGVPQKRERFILIGLIEGNPEAIFKLARKNKKEFLETKGLTKKVTLKNAISDLEKKKGTLQSDEFKFFQNGKYGKAISNYQKLMRKNCDFQYPDSHRFSNHRKATLKK